LSKEDQRTVDRAELSECIRDCRVLETNLKAYLSLEHLEEGEEAIGGLETQFVHKEGMSLGRILRTLCLVTNRAFKIFWRHTPDGLYFRYGEHNWGDLSGVQIGLGMQTLRLVFNVPEKGRMPVAINGAATAAGARTAHIEMRTDNEWDTKSFLTLLAEIPQIAEKPLFWSDAKLLSVYRDIIPELSSGMPRAMVEKVAQLGQGSGSWDKVEASVGIVAYMHVRLVEGGDASRFASRTLVLTSERVYLSVEAHEWQEDRGGIPSVRVVSSQEITNITSLGYSRLNSLDLQIIFSQEGVFWGLCVRAVCVSVCVCLLTASHQLAR
jgi:hypothetical protein